VTQFTYTHLRFQQSEVSKVPLIRELINAEAFKIKRITAIVIAIT
jgi:hypothetical protein